MDELKNIFSSDEVLEVCEVIAEYEVLVPRQKIKIKITQSTDGAYQYTLSHHYHGRTQLAPYISLRSNYQSVVDALAGAKKELFTYYNPSDAHASWVKNDAY